MLAPAASTNPDWSRIGSPPVDAPPISAAPLLAASLLFQPYGDPDGPNTVFAYGERPGGAWAWVRLDVELAHTQDAGGNRAIPLDQNSLAPGGRRAAFAQTDEVVIVDLATGDVVRIPVPGLYEEVTWIDDRQVLMSSETTTVRIDAATRAVSSETFRGHSVTPPAGPSVPITTLDGDQNNGPLMLGFPESGTSQRVDTLSARPYQFNALVPRGWRYGNLVAQSAMGHDGKGPADVVFVVNARTGVIRWLLDLGGGRNKGCCPVVGWHGPSEVLVRTEQEGLLVWNLTTGTVSRLAAPISGQMSLDPAPSR